MSIPVKDQKILWSRAMGRCSICRKRLVIDASKASPSQATLIGENCHIVAELETGPRGESKLSQKDRNRYPNLILLCREHHQVIDDDPDAYPIEILHQIKVDHELWVESLVPEAENDEVEKLYANLVNIATRCLLLSTWPGLTDHAVRDLLPLEFVDGVREFVITVRKTVWPKKYLDLEKALVNLADRAKHYIDLFLEQSYLRDKWYRQGTRWNRQLQMNEYLKHIARFEEWQGQCMAALFNLTVALNEFAQAVRATVRPTYFLHEGKFFVTDSIGVMSELEGSVYFPTEYDESV